MKSAVAPTKKIWFAKQLLPAKQNNLDKVISRNLQLDSLRGIFAIGVLFGHVEIIRQYFGLSENYLNPVVTHLGRIGVTGFFVLSGFLITVHLLRLKQERTTSPSSKLGTFYLKRILRIWPLYYTVILLSMFVLPHIAALAFKLPYFITDARSILDKFKIYYLVLLPQIPLAKNTVLPFAEPSWSIGVEEIFYLIIPLYVLFTKCKKWPLLTISVLLVALKVAMYYTIHDPFYNTLFNFFVYSRFECILLGCIAGIFFFENQNTLNKPSRAFFLLSVAAILFFTAIITTPTYIYLHFAAAFAIIVLYAAYKPVRVLNNRLLGFFGTISYSLYMTHEIAIVFLLNNKHLSAFVEDNDLLLYTLSFVLATGLGFVTYSILEYPFMKLKKKIGKT